MKASRFGPSPAGSTRPLAPPTCDAACKNLFSYVSNDPALNLGEGRMGRCTTQLCCHSHTYRVLRRRRLLLRGACRVASFAAPSEVRCGGRCARPPASDRGGSEPGCPKAAP